MKATETAKTVTSAATGTTAATRWRLATFAFLAVGAGINAVVITLSPQQAVELAFAFSLLVLGIVGAFLIERSRWTYRRAPGRHRRFRRPTIRPPRPR